ncbi:MAG: hypothetical protein JSU04_16495 [Bdellovibrionales bacterium]|nr:hypothetical protein [Bdellovibrionales bacterium]
MRLLMVFLGLFILSTQTWAQYPIFKVPGLKPAEKIPALNADPNSITVSGLSSGAFMAVQLGVAYSKQIKGVAAIAGGIYNCAEGNVDTATNVCMKNPANIKPETYMDLAKSSFKKSLIDDPANLTQQRVFILNGTEDKTVAPIAGHKLEEFYKSFGANPRTEYSLKMGHAFPSNKGKNECSVSQFPWLNNCKYDGAKAILETLYGPLNQVSKKQTTSGELLTIDQTEFAKADAKMLDAGNLYIPSVCRDKKTQCRIHVALHGCLQGPNIVQKAFIEDAGYNEWADKNKIIVLYPAVGMGSGNPNGCWDWFGYTGENYAVKSAPQMTAIMNMVQRLTEN